MVQDFRGLRKFFGGCSFEILYGQTLFHHEGAKDTKVSDHFSNKTLLKLRDLRDLRGKILSFLFGCGSAALGLCGESFFTGNPE
jgi:hypothetical protein